MTEMVWPVPLSGMTLLGLFVVVVVLPVALVGLSLRFVRSVRSGRLIMQWHTVAMVLLFLVVTGWVVSRVTEVRLENDLLVMRSAFYQQSLPRDSLRWDAAQLQSEPAGECRLSYRINGISLLRYHVGWFRGEGGRVFALATLAPYLSVPLVSGGAALLSLGEQGGHQLLQRVEKDGDVGSDTAAVR